MVPTTITNIDIYDDNARGDIKVKCPRCTKLDKRITELEAEVAELKDEVDELQGEFEIVRDMLTSTTLDTEHALGIVSDEIRR